MSEQVPHIEALTCRDADWCDGEIAAGRAIVGETILLDRKLRAAHGVAMTDCVVKLTFPLTMDDDRSFCGVFDGPLTDSYISCCQFGPRCEQVQKLTREALTIQPSADVPQLEAWQFQPDDDCPGLYLQCANRHQRAEIMALLGWKAAAA